MRGKKLNSKENSKNIPLHVIKHDSIETFGSHIINYSDVHIERKIGEGSFGTVYK